jgi:D-alanyl-D-alanine dipeptidase
MNDLDGQTVQIQNLSNHKFDSWGRKLMDLPFSPSYPNVVSGDLQRKYSVIAIKENGEVLVPCEKYGLVSKDYYLNKLIDGDDSFNNQFSDHLLFPFAWVRKSVAGMLQQIDIMLREHGMFLVVNSGWRSPQVQAIAKQGYAKNNSKKLAESRFASTELDGKTVIPPHSTGGAVDLELWSLQVNGPLSFSYPGDTIGIAKLENEPNLSEVDKAKRDIRRILFNLLVEQHFTVNPNEFWHFSLGDQMNAYLSRRDNAVYVSTQPPSDYLICPY